MDPEITVSPSRSRRESAAFYVLLATVILAPLAFFPSPYVPFDLVKTAVIAFGTIISFILYISVAFTERELILPHRATTWLAVSIGLSLAISVILSGVATKSFLGQGFEIGTASFILVMLLSTLVAFMSVRRSPERAIVVYAGMVISFLVIYIFQFFRLILGTGFLSMSFLNTATSTILGGWYSLGIYSLLVVILSMIALALLPLSRRARIIYWIFIVLGSIGAIIVNSDRAFQAASLIFLGLAIYLSYLRPSEPGKGLIASWLKRLAWIPTIAFIIAIVFAWRGSSIAGPLVDKLGVGYNELSLPWQLTIDVGAGAIKDHPFFGVGPNRFSQAYITYKPLIINSTSAWNVEFSYGFGLIPTFVATQGVVGAVLWVLWFVMLGILGVRSLRRLPESPEGKFVITSSYMGAVFLSLVALCYVPSHAMLFYMFMLTGLWAGAAVAYGVFQPWRVPTVSGASVGRVFRPALIVVMIISVVWGFEYIRTTAAMAYFASGVRELTVANDPDLADAKFKTALALQPSDVYFQARAEAALAKVNSLISSAGSNPSPSASQAIATQAASIINQAIAYSESAIAYDPTNYYNYLSEARVSQSAANIRMANGYEQAVASYGRAIALNPYNPGLYLSLGQFQASQNKLDDALKSVGAAIQVKNNYLDAIFTLSQIEASRGDLGSAITAAAVATKINPDNPLLFFQLGLLEYTNKSYDLAAESLETAVKLSPNYANAQYFLGLSYSRLGRNVDAIKQFQSLAVSNPDNKEVALILSNLEAGKSPFADAKPPITPTPEKRQKLPIPAK